MNPVVSVCITTFNHAGYIRQALEGVMEQQTDFPIEVLVGEDGSTDGTREICKEFAQKYPDQIRLFEHDRSNVIHINGRVTGRYNFLYNLKHASGKYIALLDGDDYWCDTNKLKKQVKILEKNAALSMCFHDSYILKNEKLLDDFINNETKTITSVNDMARGNYIRTASVMFRNYYLNEKLPEVLKETPVADYVLHVLHATRGKIYFLPEKMCVYRYHDSGVWSGYGGTRMQTEWMDMLEKLIGFLENEPADIMKIQFSKMAHNVAGKYKEMGDMVNTDIYLEKSNKYGVDVEALKDVSGSERKNNKSGILDKLKKIFSKKQTN